jgi:hypothetical protein
MTGWLNPLPEQSGIPGWQRITLMKHFQEVLDLSDPENHWAYEGVVLPGGRIILGRWWYASEEVDFDVSISWWTSGYNPTANAVAERLRWTLHPLGRRVCA